MTREEVKNLLNINKVYIEAFFNISPYSLSTLKSMKKQEPLIFYKHLGSLWIWLSGETFEQTAKYFNKNHATIIHSVNSVINAKDYHYKNLLEVLINENNKILVQNNLEIKELLEEKTEDNKILLKNKLEVLNERLNHVQTELNSIKEKL